MIAPDCGLAMLPEPIAIAKLQNMVEATKQMNVELAVSASDVNSSAE